MDLRSVLIIDPKSVLMLVPKSALIMDPESPLIVGLRSPLILGLKSSLNHGSGKYKCSLIEKLLHTYKPFLIENKGVKENQK